MHLFTEKSHKSLKIGLCDPLLEGKWSSSLFMPIIISRDTVAPEDHNFVAVIFLNEPVVHTEP